ncbi:SUR7/PalI family-domain-containing protein [Halteromyces radiatus]|uniref:SUR7/PalI family-domain-containing protein n=1 Tax=Halteromyces radiatus TaxID=101107 RepID=UPI00221E5596|nr:SUR7/PalI family-domain-containing protein [Halteromyces radiatus]KAI8099601.1 SUR7/PalI family-domain-containing protein [Halteromyces radiatus]
MYFLFSSLGSFFTFASFILNLFIVIGQLSNRAFINRLYFAQAYHLSSSQYYNLGLWNYCTSNDQGVQSCSHPTPGYNWVDTPAINQTLSSLPLSKGLFLGAFILFIIGLCFSFILWVISMPLCCVKHRAVGGSMSTFTFITFLVMLTALIMELVFIIRGNYLLHSVDPTWTGHAGNSLWLTIGSVVSLLFAFFSYGGSCCCIGGKGAATSRKSKKASGRVGPTYGGKYGDGDEEAAGEGTHAIRSPYNLNQSVYHTVGQQSPHMSQQPYQAQPGSPHVPSNLQQQPQQPQQPAYQTPILQHADVSDQNV